ncbi:HxlR family transcriptional regulator [Branchiibius sp. NY16-3462-2]|nr:HxlR family transcriptional regulator [Branchiibius sp. NY16-3462-2]
MAGALANRGDQPLGQWCPMERSLALLGNRVSFVLLREVAYGTTRFDHLVKRVGVTESVAARRLRELVDAGVLTKVPYQEPGQRQRFEYALTDAGHELLPVLLSLHAWGSRHIPGRAPRLRHEDCGAPVTVKLVCENGHDLTEEIIEVG